MEEFLKRGSDPFSRNAIGETPIHVVCRSAKFSSRRSKRKLELLKMMLSTMPKVSKEQSYSVVPSSTSLEHSTLPSKRSSSLGSAEDKVKSLTLQGRVGAIKVKDSVDLGVQDKVKYLEVSEWCVWYECGMGVWVWGDTFSYIHIHVHDIAELSGLYTSFSLNTYSPRTPHSI